MKAISLWQPWASLVVMGFKRYETRHWRAPHYMGPLAIHAAKKWDSLLRETLYDFREEWPALQLPATVPLGCIVGVVELFNCQLIGQQQAGGLTFPTLDGRLATDSVSRLEEAFGDWSPGRYAWRLNNPRRLLTPAPYRGAQGFFEVPDDLLSNADFEVSAEQLAKAPR